MSKNTEDLVLNKGATFRLSRRWIQTNRYGVCTPVDLSDTSAVCRVRKRAGDPVIAEFSTSNGLININGPAGLISLRMEAEQTLTLPTGVYRYEMQIHFPDYIDSFLSGTFSINGSIV